ncbi:glucosaminidase domain-containing protein [Candidatus Thioglobus autotrophicus]|uniref:glucosaminidase domain-containing protein n=1 Tax=Candidatus Thioglobus autotrophicus TaxID=1705394 RepID=UPI0006B664F4|nr:glucosaminidase domain-containing protein [Candidatus Thioglobus autotrophicus]WPE16285.1 glucosaminidase domain-containing protein [Candidatus Thioglobus autotrophicus]WPE17833.1 glucosaminidase domain-containing protein [Candidatus Thioglobus autotrophicus]
MKILKFNSALLTFLLFTSPIQANEFWGLESWMNSLKTPDFTKIKDVNQRKQAFFEYLLPEINKQNEKIVQLRHALKTDNINSFKLQKIYNRYRVKEGDIDTLLMRVDIIPASLILAQGAYESNWGRSRFAKYYHNFFGLWCFEKGCGIVPLKRDKAATHEVAKFSSLDKSVEYYMRSINRNSAYATLRKIRKNKRDKQAHITGLALAEGLENYAEIGYEYVETVQSIIRYNKLSQYDYKS